MASVQYHKSHLALFSFPFLLSTAAVRKFAALLVEKKKIIDKVAVAPPLVL